MTRPLDIPTIRVPNAAGGLAVRDGVTVTLFLRKRHAEVAAAVIAAIEQFRAFAGDAFPPDYVDDEGDIAPFDDRAWQTAMAAMREQPNASLQLLDSPSGASGVSLTYQGFDLETFAEASPMLTIGLTTELLRERGAAELARFATDLAAALPVHHGYASPALHHSGSSAAFAQIRSLCFLFPGFDIHDRSAPMQLGGRIRGAYWLNFFSADLVTRLGGAAAFQRLAGDGLTVEPMADGMLRVATAGEPAAGNIAEERLLPGCRALAEIVEPLLYHAGQPFPAFTEEEMQRWERRFLDPPPVTMPE